MILAGSIHNRLNENRMLCGKIEVGTKATEYLWADRLVYEVVKVIDQSHVYIRRMLATGPDGKCVSDESMEPLEMKRAGGKWRGFVRTWNGRKWREMNITFGVADGYAASFDW